MISQVITHLDQLERVHYLLDTAPKYVVVDTETSGLRPYHGDFIIGVSLYFPHVDEGYYIPTAHTQDNVDFDLSGLDLSREDITYIGFNYKFDLHFLGQAGIKEASKIEDVMILAHLLNENEYLTVTSGKLINRKQKAGAYQLKRLAAKYLGQDATEGEDELKAEGKRIGKDPKKEMRWLSPAIVGKYAIYDVWLTWRLREFYYPSLIKWGLEPLYLEHNEFTLKALTRMERNGFWVNQETVDDHIATLNPRIAKLKEKLVEAARSIGLNPKGGFNPNSSMQVTQFFDLLGIHLVSTRKFNLERLKEANNEWAGKFLDYRTMLKANTSFYKPYIEAMDANGFVHSTFNPVGTTSGRLSASKPNPQQLPKTTKAKKYMVKEIIQPPPRSVISQVSSNYKLNKVSDYVIAQFDYTTLELRIAVNYAQEWTMGDMMKAGVDFHQYTADRLTELLGRPIDRHTGKTCNFALLYGMGKKKGAEMFVTDEDTALEIIEAWHEIYPSFRRAAASALVIAERKRDAQGGKGHFQFVRLREGGRVRRYHEFDGYYQLRKDPKTGDEKVRPYAPHYTAWNYIVQGTAAAITERSILRVVKHFSDNDLVKPIGTVHDSVLFYLHKSIVHEAVPTIIEMMTDHPQFDPPLLVAAEIGVKSWGDMKEYKVE